ncbi:MAG: VWA domain-containing protein [Proteobacteria bacterium]|nr:VWA domain-containing protein [Pseudomonadota bacterium]
MNSKLRTQTMSIFVTSLFLARCGEATFGTGSSGRGSDNTPETSSLAGLDWYWQCDSAPGSAPSQEKGRRVITGSGTHEMSKQEFEKGVPVSISGKLCPPAKYPRDIVFVVDVSRSMAMDRPQDGNDAITNQSCNRMRAIEEVIADATSQGSDARFGITTFTNVEIHSSAMFANKDELFADIGKINNSTPAEAICAAVLGTYYGKGMSGANTLLSGSRKNAIKEIYFVSDGAPEDGSAGPDIATAMKTNGITIDGQSHKVQIATAMIGSTLATNATKLKEMASLDPSGNPLTANGVKASDLAKTLRGFAENKIDDGTLKYRPVGEDDWTSVALKGNMTGNDFKIPNFNLSPAEAPDGLEVSFEYRDKYNNVYASGGTIKWTVQKKKP